MEKQTILKEEKIKGGEKMKPILIVEDEAIVRESLRDWLTDGGYQVETVERGEEALKALVEQDFGVVILDMKLPGKDGLKVLREAKAHRPQLKGIIITAYPSVPTAVEAMKIGAIDYLTKPFDLNDLEKLIRETLGPVQVEIKPKAVTEEAVAEPIVVEEARPRYRPGVARQFRQTSLEDGSKAYDACVFGDSLVSKRLCIHRWQCYHCPFFDQIAYEADMKRVKAIVKAGETAKKATEMKPILIVEDEAIMRESLRDWLRDGGYEVETVEGGDGALQRIGEKEFGVVVLDLRLPGRDGLEVLKEVKARRAELKGVIITAYPSVETAVEAMKLGAVDYLVKPFAPDALEKLIGELWTRSR